MRGIDRVLVLAALCLAAFGCGDRGHERSPQHPTPTATPAVLSCPTKLTYTTLAGSDLDVGSSGIYFDQQTGEGGSLSFALACPGAFPGCGVCALSGPIQSTTPIDNHRCDNATETRCTSNADCSGGGACAFFFGAPLPISGGGVPVCVTTRVNGAVTGTVNPADGSGASNLDTLLSIHLSLTVDQPCPTCSGASVGTTGTCNGGPRAGQACVVHGLSPVFGDTSFDCPPNASADIGDLDGPLNLTTGTRAL